ncbi:MAG TPA: response regulator transcription factor [Brumimicrobium sp.]|nr:response regulator transcription factor [Brumimicrobium sp.]
MKPKILLVEDDTSLGFIVSDQLKMEGYDVTLASDGMEGFKRFNESTYHLCIFDVMMPKKDGFSLAEDVRKVDKSIPILFLTAKSMTEDKVKGFNVGGDDYLTKPFSSAELKARVRALLKRVDISVNKENEDEIKIGHFTYDLLNYTLKSADFEKKLTKKEAQILKMLGKFENQVVQRELVLNAVWGKDDYFVGRSLDVFITKLRKYLSGDPKVSIENIHGIGFKLTVEK